MPATLRELSIQERHELAVAAALACVRRLEAMTQRADPRDEALQRLLESLANKALVRAEELECCRPTGQPTGTCRLTRKETGILLRRHFPSLASPLGEGCLTRETATSLAECMEEECAAFYQSLAEGTEDQDSGIPFKALGRQHLSFLEFVRHVLL